MKKTDYIAGEIAAQIKTFADEQEYLTLKPKDIFAFVAKQFYEGSSLEEVQIKTAELINNNQSINATGSYEDAIRNLDLQHAINLIYLNTEANKDVYQEELIKSAVSKQLEEKGSFIVTAQENGLFSDIGLVKEAAKNKPIMLLFDKKTTTDRLERDYAYVFGTYLGNGYISAKKAVQVLRIAYNSAYEEIIRKLSLALKRLFKSRVLIMKRRNKNAVEVRIACAHLERFFPQHGIGKKHTRKIELHDWQKGIIEKHPVYFIRGLIHSDGSRYMSNGYVVYSFSNFSDDILDIFCYVCDLLDVRYKRYATRVVIAQRPSVKKMEKFVGPKISKAVTEKISKEEMKEELADAGVEAELDAKDGKKTNTRKTKK